MSVPAEDRQIVVGQFAGPHGVRGQFKLRSFTEDPWSITTFGPLTTGDGRTLTPKLYQELKPGLFLATAPEIKTREDCEPYAGAILHTVRDAFDDPDEDEFYYADLVGLHATTESGAAAGVVKAIVNYGAGDIMELSAVPGRGTLLLPFTKADIPEIDLAAGRIVVVLPPDGDDAPVGA